VDDLSILFDAVPPRFNRRLLAISGGADSMALLDAAATHAHAKKIFLAVGHVDHGLRGTSSAADAAFVRRETLRRGLPFQLMRVPVKAFAAREKMGLEQAARTLRYQALARMARRLTCDAVLTAHTLNDQAETMLMNLIRGTGPDGLGGMTPTSSWPVPGRPGDKQPTLIRPFLDVTREEIIAHLRRSHTPSREDATNADPTFFRNRVRPLVGLFEKERPGFLDRMGRLASLLQDEETYWKTTVAALCRRNKIEAATFKKYHTALQRRILRHRLPLTSFAAVERARLFILNPGTAVRQSVPGGWIEKRNEHFTFRRLARRRTS
jgi:tRNA(Ile)-lysidine synthase